MALLLWAGWLAFGLIQLAAINDGVQYWAGLPWFVSGFVALILAYFPVAGSIFCFIAAWQVWGLPVWEAVLLAVPSLAFMPLVFGAPFLTRPRTERD